MTPAAHHLVTVTRLWATGPEVVGIFATREAAEAAVASTRRDDHDPDRYSIETWRDHQRGDG